MRISIAMCTYNGAPFVREQLDSIARQTRLPDELIVSDDRSSDQTLEIIEEFSSVSPFPVHVSINNKNLGITKNSERAMRSCDGDIIFPCDQDDVWHPEKLKLVEALFLSAPRVGLVFSDAELVDADLRSQGRNLFGGVGFGQRKRRLVTSGRAIDLLMAQTVVCGATMAFRSKFKKFILPIPTEGPLIQDGWIALIIAAVAEIAFIEKPLIKYRQHPAQQMGGRRTSTFQSVIRAHKTPSDSYLAQAAQFEEAYDRLAAGNGNPVDGRVLLLVRQKIAHLHERANMPPQRLRRISPVLREVLNHRYDRFSRGWLSAAKDLLA